MLLGAVCARHFSCAAGHYGCGALLSETQVAALRNKEQESVVAVDNFEIWACSLRKQAQLQQYVRCAGHPVHLHNKPDFLCAGNCFDRLVPQETRKAPATF